MNLFDRLFGRAAKQLGSAAMAKAERETVGKAEAKVMGAQAQMQQKAMRKMDSAMDPNAIKNKVSGGGAQAEQDGPANANYAPQYEALQQPQGEAEQPLLCPNGHPIDPSWEVCPYCRTAASQGVGAAHVQPGGGGAAPGKTVAISAEDIAGSEHVNKAVVGWLVCMEGTQKGQDFRLFDGRNVVGTAADCDLVVFDGYVSARHAVILIESPKSRYTVQDLDSRNHTYVNRQQIMKQDLVDNDEIRWGNARFRFKSLY